MKKDVVLVALFTCMLLFSCTYQAANRAETTGITGEQLFEKGERITNDHFTGNVWLNNLVRADSLNQNAVGCVTFEPGARTYWHIHPAGQIIIALDGVGYYQEEGGPKIIVTKGDVMKCPPDIPHWHGASADSAFVQLAITGREKGETIWLNEVTDEVYHE